MRVLCALKILQSAAAAAGVAAAAAAARVNAILRLANELWAKTNPLIAELILAELIVGSALIYYYFWKG